MQSAPLPQMYYLFLIFICALLLRLPTLLVGGGFFRPWVPVQLPRGLPPILCVSTPPYVLPVGLRNGWILPQKHTHHFSQFLLTFVLRSMFITFRVPAAGGSGGLQQWISFADQYNLHPDTPAAFRFECFNFCFLSFNSNFFFVCACAIMCEVFSPTVFV